MRGEGRRWKLLGGLGKVLGWLNDSGGERGVELPYGGVNGGRRRWFIHAGRTRAPFYRKASGEDPHKVIIKMMPAKKRPDVDDMGQCGQSAARAWQGSAVGTGARDMWQCVISPCDLVWRQDA
jgi:hypothetical protein